MIRVLLDINIIVYRESDNVFKDNIGELYHIIDNNPEMIKFVHPASVEELKQNKYNDKRKILSERLKSYNELERPLKKANTTLVSKINSFNKDNNDFIDDILLSEIYDNRCDILITEDKKMKEKAILLGIGDKIQNINEFIFKNKEQKKVEHNLLDINKVKMKDINIDDSFFDDLKNNYNGFEKWFKRKAEEEAYCDYEGNDLKAMLFLKNEEPEDEDYSDISPTMRMNRKLKISTFKVDVVGKKIGERFFKIIFDQAIYSMVDEIYVTIFDNSDGKKRLIKYFESFGFRYHGKKKTGELVYVREMKKCYDNTEPLKTYPYIDSSRDSFVVAINPYYHAILLPDSRLKNETYKNKNVSVEYAIKKCFVSNAGWAIKPKVGDNVVFYRTKMGDIPAKYSSVLTTIGIVTNIVIPKDIEELRRVVRKRTALTEREIELKYDKNTYVIEFAYVTTLDNKLNFNICNKNDILKDYPRGVAPIQTDQFKKILELGEVNEKIIL